MALNIPDGFYTISAVEKLTGVNKITIRAWETRHGFISPQRTGSGRRIYTQRDIDRIKLAVQLKEQGVAISRVKSVIEDSHIEQMNVLEDDEWEFYRNQMLQAVEGFNEYALDVCYAKASSLFPLETVIKELMVPVLHRLGERWDSNLGGIAEEHFFSTFMRNKLGARLDMKRNNAEESLFFIAACLPGETHELGLLVFAHAAEAIGYHVVLLGSNVPIDEVLTVSERLGCDGIVIACSVRPFTPSHESDLSKLCTASQVPVFVGGKGSLVHERNIKSCGAKIIGDDPCEAVELITACRREI